MIFSRETYLPVFSYSRQRRLTGVACLAFFILTSCSPKATPKEPLKYGPPKTTKIDDKTKSIYLIASVLGITVITHFLDGD